MSISDVFYKILNAITSFIIGLLSLVINGDKPNVKIPPITNPLLLESATSLSSKIRSRKVRSEDAVEAYIARIKECNPILNFQVKDRFNDALEEARKIDAILDADNTPERYSEKNAPFLGVPLSVKEAFSVVGMPNCSGLVNRKDIISTQDAPVVANLRRAGCIVLGVTNTSELCMWYESANFVYGRTNNPYDVRRIVGGSSGGEGCILGAGAAVIGVGSDIGGSIRMPCFFNGVFGHKPSSDVTISQGQFPCSQGKTLELLATGPMCRYAVDLEPMLRIMAGPHGVAKLKLDDHVDLRALRYFSMGDNVEHSLVSKLDPELKEIQNKVVKYLQETLDVEVNRNTLRRMRHAVALWSAKMTVDDEESFTSLLGTNGSRVIPLLELVKRMVGLSSHTVPAIALALTENINHMWPTQTTRLMNSCDKLLDEIQNVLGDDGVLIYPSHPKLAPFHNAPLMYPTNFAHTGLFNALNLPATQVPLGLSAQGIPLGIQVVANRHNDHLCLAVARELERGFGGWATQLGMGQYHQIIEDGADHSG